MGWVSRATGCACLLTLSAQANAGARIDYPSAGQMYALLATDVQVTYGSVLPKAPIAAAPVAAPGGGDPMPILLPARRSFEPVAISFAPSVRNYVVPVTADTTPPPVIDAQANSFWNIRQDVFPEEQRIRLRSPMDAMLTFSIGGASGPGGSLSIDGGVAGALWSMRQHQ
jgi:hypothetical protein